MNETRIERVDSIPLIIHWLLKMQIAEIIDRVLPPSHNNRRGLSYGQLAVLFVTYVLYLRDHRLCAMKSGWQTTVGCWQKRRDGRPVSKKRRMTAWVTC